MLIGSVVWAGEIGVVRGKSRISTRNRKNTEMTVPISCHNLLCQKKLFLSYILPPMD